jgi:hypothetical protein
LNELVRTSDRTSRLSQDGCGWLGRRPNWLI